MRMVKDYDVMIIGAGAAGLMCAITAGRRGRRVCLIDHRHKIGEKIRISGGGRCNFTNIHTRPENFLSQNPHFCKSALKQYTPQDFIALLDKHGIAWHEKKLGQLFCDGTASQIVDMLVTQAKTANATLHTGVKVTNIAPASAGGYVVETDIAGAYTCASLVIATGGLSIPKIGATNFGYELANRFGLPVVPPRAALVPLTFAGDFLDRCKTLSGVSVDAQVRCGKTAFAEGLLFTHRGLSGPSVLQISSYWREGQAVTINLAPQTSAESFLKDRKNSHPKQHIDNVLAEILPKRLAQDICDRENLSGNIGECADKKLGQLAQSVNAWHVTPTGTEGYRTAEVTLGGIDTRALSSKTMEAAGMPGLYFIGEVMDVTGHLGGFNFQWAWSSGYAAGQAA